MLTRRKPGQSLLTTKRNEADTIKILSGSSDFIHNKEKIFLLGLENELTLGTPIGFIIQNQDVLKQDYSDFNAIPRPGHADLTYLMKYGVKAESGGGLIPYK